MPRTARLVAPGFPHHVTQRGVRRQRTFFSDVNYSMYLDLLRELAKIFRVSILAYCLMPNHVHAILIPRSEEGLSKLMGQVNGRYAQKVNLQNGWQGHLWQARFYSVVMDEPHTLAAIRYVEQNPVRAGLCERADQWRWSSAWEAIGDCGSDIIDRTALQTILATANDAQSGFSNVEFDDELRGHTRSGRPLGSDEFIKRVEVTTGRRASQIEPGRPPKH